MKELAQNIRRGLATEGVIEACEAWGATMEGGVVVANVVGLALIGAIGKESAVCMLIDAFEESALGEEAGARTREVITALGLTDTSQTEDLAERHMEGSSASSLADDLEAGRLSL
ncbi:MAG: hypothetical protein AAB490_02745 [Patescibacteria group bacterium]|mgnify:FL=1